MFPGNRVADGSPHSPQAAGEKEAKPKIGQDRLVLRYFGPRWTVRKTPTRLSKHATMCEGPQSEEFPRRDSSGASMSPLLSGARPFPSALKNSQDGALSLMKALASPQRSDCHL